MHRIELTEIERKKISELGKIKTPSLWQPIETAPKDGTEVDLWARPYTGVACGGRTQQGGELTFAIRILRK